MSGFPDGQHPSGYGSAFATAFSGPETDFTPDSATFLSSEEGNFEANGLPSAGLGTWFEGEEQTNAPQEAPKGPPRVRRRPLPGSDHVKHRRTRSGCYTCRSRRVKCDETHPVCQRCSKGSRECVYPNTPSGTKSGSSSKTNRPSDTGEGSSSEEDVDDGLSSPSSRGEFSTALTTGTDSFFDSSVSPPPNASPFTKSRSEASSQSSPGLNPFRPPDLHRTHTLRKHPNWVKLNSEQRSLLEYQQQHVTAHTYLLKGLNTSFFDNRLLLEALSFDPLLHAVCGFAAYHRALSQETAGSSMSEFLSHYNKSLHHLRRSLQSATQQKEAVILTILQLATFEEYLGDWGNLMGHQRAACFLIQQHYTPQNIMQSEVHAVMLVWYLRFDVVASFLSGGGTMIGMDWFVAQEQYYRERWEQQPQDLALYMASLYASNRMFGLELGDLLARLKRGEIAMTDFMKENQRLSLQSQAGDAKMQPLMDAPPGAFASPDRLPRTQTGDEVDPGTVKEIFVGSLWDVNYLRIDLLAVAALHEKQLAMVLNRPPDPVLRNHAVRMCEIFEAIGRFEDAPPGAILPAQASIGLASILLPAEPKYISWCRRTFSSFEARGYIYPPRFRIQMAEMWSIPSLRQNWLPPEEAPMKPLIQSIRSFIEDRNAGSDQNPTTRRSQLTEDLREMRGMFSSLRFEDSPTGSPPSMSTTSGETSLAASAEFVASEHTGQETSSPGQT